MSVQQAGPANPEIPFILQGKYFSINSIDKKSGKVSATCQICNLSGKSKPVNGFIHPTSNFVTHLKVHTEHYEKYRKDMMEPGNKLKPAHSCRQPTLPFERVVIPSKVIMAERLIVDYIVDAMAPLSTVENEAFQRLVDGLCSGFRVPDRRRLSSLIVDKYASKVKTLIKDLESAKYYCVTADIWSSHHRSFFGTTVHWLNTEFQRKSSVLTLSRCTGTHDFEKVTEMLVNTFEKFKISTEKLSCVVTDNASNFVKAFREHGVKLAGENNDPDDQDDDLNLVEIEDLASLPTLPLHQRCASHTLSLIATTDLDNASIVTPRGPDNFKKVFRSTLAKCNGIWNSISRSVKVAEDVKSICGKMLSRPGATRWNSLFDAIRDLLEVREHLSEICKFANVQAFIPIELDLLQEYSEAVKPIAYALDKLQGQNSFYFGYLAPVILQTKKKLDEICMERRRFGSPIAKALLAGLEKRFTALLNLDLTECAHAIFASISYPYFKLRWIQPDHQNRLKTAFINDAKAFKAVSVGRKPDPKPEPALDDKFFDFGEPESDEIDAINAVELECLQYFKDPSTELGSLLNYPTVREMFFKYNTSLASSGAVERAFSYGGMIFSPKRANLSDEMLNMLVFLKVNY